MTEERMIRVKFGDNLKLVLNVIPNVIRIEDTEPAPPKDWQEKMKDLEQRNLRLSRFIMDWLDRDLDIFPEGALSISDILSTGRKME